jgi:DNA replication initiation complex subunit (GINS family)
MDTKALLDIYRKEKMSPYLHIYRKEKMSPYLQDLGEDFYSEVKGVIRELESAYDASKGQTKKESRQLRELENLKSVVLDLYEIRERKVVLGALNYVRREGEDIEMENITAEEEKMLEDVVALLKNNRKIVLEGDSGKSAKKAPKKKKEAKSRDKSTLITVRITKDLPAIVGADGKVYGEFKEEDVVSLPDANAKALIEQGAAEEIGL